MSDIGGNEGETSESETDSSSDAHEKSELHQTEATAGDVSEAEKPADSTEAAADRAEKSEMHEAEAAAGDVSEAEKPADSTEAAADQAEKSELHQAEAAAGDVSEAEKPADSTEAAADQAEKSLMAQAAAQDDWSNAGLQTENVVYPPPTPPTIQVGLMLNTDVAINVFFIVTIDTVDLGAWSKCTGLGMKIESKAREEYGMTLFQHNLPGHLVYDPIVLERPLTSDSRAVMSWFMSYHMLPIPTSGVITCVDQKGIPIMSWEMTGITPVSWKGPDFDATAGSALPTEKLTFAHQGFL